MKRSSLHNRYSRRTLVLAAIFAPVLLLLIGGGVYAALGGSIRPSTSSDIELQKGLVGHWKFDGNARDSTPNANNGTVTSATLAADRKAKANAAYAFNGSNAYITVPDSNVLTQTTITASAWVNPSSAGTIKNILSKASNNEYRVRLTATNTIQVLDRGATNIVTTTATIPINQWSLVSFTGDATGIKIYINGQLSSSGGAAFAPPNTTGVLTLGGNAANNELFGGSIDDIRLYSRALSAGEMAALYRSYDVALKTSEGEKGLVGRWKFDGSAKDSTSYAHNGTAANVSLSADRKGAANRAYTFAGTQTSCVTLPTSSVLNTSVFTFSAWVRPTVSGIATVIGSSTGNNPQLRIESNGLVGLVKQNVVNLGYSTQPVPLNQWSHITVSYSASGVYTFYINGIDAGTGTNLQAFSFTNYTIGCKTGVENYTGAIDDVRIYNRVLSAQEVKNISQSYNSQVNLYRGNGTSETINITTGLKGWWPFNGTAKDVTPYASNGVAVGSPSLTTDRRNRANSAYNFSGSGQYFTAGANTALSFTDNFTISAWIYPTSYHTVGFFGLKNGIVSRGPASTFNYALQATDATTISFIKRTSPEGIQFYNFTGVPNLTNQWTLTTAVVSGGSVKLYVNGALHGTLAVGTIASVAGDIMYIGTDGGANTEAQFIGKIDDPRVYARPLSAADISLLYATYN